MLRYRFMSNITNRHGSERVIYMYDVYTISYFVLTQNIHKTDKYTVQSDRVELSRKH